MANLPTLPITAQLVYTDADGREDKTKRPGYLTPAMARDLQARFGRVNQAPYVARVLSLPDLDAAIATSVLLVAPTAGLYLVSWRVRITQAAGVSSSVTVTIGYTDSTVSCAEAGPAITGNTTSTVKSGLVLIRSDGAIAITYATAFASVGVPAATYQLDLVVQPING